MINLSGRRLSIDGVETGVLDSNKFGFDLRGRTYTVRRTGFFGPLYELMRDGETLASAQQSATRLRFAVTSGGRTWTLKSERTIGNKFGLFDGDTRVGGITPLSAKDFAIDLPVELPLETQVFLTWLFLWKWSAT